MKNSLQVFNNGTFNVRTLQDEAGIWFVARDVAAALDYSESSNPARLIQSVPDFWKGVKPFHTPGGEQEMLCLTEQGLYFFLGRSDKPKALPYQMWIAGDVVPAIRKHGLYATPQTVEKILNDPDAFIQLLQAFKNERAKSAALEQENTTLQAQVEKDRPKVIFADAVDASKESILIGNLAKILNQNGCSINGKSIGQNKLFIWLRENGYLMNCRGERYNMPTQRSIEKGLFEVKKVVINNPDGSTKITHTTKVTGKGQIYFTNLFIENSQD